MKKSTLFQLTGAVSMSSPLLRDLRPPHHDSTAALRPAPRKLAVPASVAPGNIRVAIRPLGPGFAGSGAGLGQYRSPTSTQPRVRRLSQLWRCPQIGT